MVSIAPGKIIRRGNRIRVGLKSLRRIDRRNHRHPLRLTPRRTPQQKPAHQTEHRGIHCDPQRQRELSNHSEARILPQLPQSVTQVLNDRLHSRLLPDTPSEVARFPIKTTAPIAPNHRSESMLATKKKRNARRHRAPRVRPTTDAPAREWTDAPP